MFGFPPGPSRPRTRRTPTLFNPDSWGDCKLWLRSDSVVPVADPYAVPYDRSTYGQSVTVRSTGDGQKLLQVPSTAVLPAAWWMGGAAVVSTPPPLSDSPWTVVLVHGYPRRQVLGGAMLLWNYGVDDNMGSPGLGVSAAGLYQVHYGGATPPTTTAISQSSVIDVCIVASDGTNVVVRVNGSEESALASYDVGSAAAGFVLGDSIGFVAPYDGMVYELAIYPTALSSDARSAINTLLQAQYRTGR